jgi:hypothetical protein
VLAGSEAFTQAIYYAKNIAAATAGANTVTVSFNAAAIDPDIRIVEYSGINSVTPLDVSVAATGSSATGNSGTVTTTNAMDLLLGANIVWTCTTGPGSGFSQRLLTNRVGDIVEDAMATAVGSYSASAPLSSAGPSIMQMAAFRAANSDSSSSSSSSPTPHLHLQVPRHVSVERRYLNEQYQHQRRGVHFIYRTLQWELHANHRPWEHNHSHVV